MTRINYDNRKFRLMDNSGTGEVSGDTVFQYHQADAIVWAEYSGGEIARGHLIALCDDQGNLDMSYHHVNLRDEIMSGRCRSTPEILPGGRIRLHEKWQWTSGDLAWGESVLEEL